MPVPEFPYSRKRLRTAWPRNDEPVQPIFRVSLVPPRPAPPPDAAARGGAACHVARTFLRSRGGGGRGAGGPSALEGPLGLGYHHVRRPVHSRVLGLGRPHSLCNEIRHRRPRLPAP